MMLDFDPRLDPPLLFRLAKDATPCGRRARALDCLVVQARSRLSPVYAEQQRGAPCNLDTVGAAAKQVSLFAAVLGWPTGDWMRIVERARDAMPLQGAEELALAALQIELLEACSVQVPLSTRIQRAQTELAALRASPDHDPRLDARITGLQRFDAVRCYALRMRRTGTHHAK
jgi:hypothetical protein